MKTAEILNEIKKLPIEKRIIVIEKAMHLVLDNKTNEHMVKAAEALYGDYCNDKELTAFSDLDLEDFYEAR